MEIIKERCSGNLKTEQLSGVTEMNILTIPPNSSISCMANLWDVLLNLSSNTAYVFIAGSTYEIINDSSSYATIICMSSSTVRCDYYQLSKLLFECGFLALQDDVVIK